MHKLPPEILKLAKKALYVKDTKIPVSRLLDLLATPKGDVSKLMNYFPELNDRGLREAFHNCAELLKALQTYATKSGSTTHSQEQIAISQSSYPSEEAKTLLKQAKRIKIFVDGTTYGNPGPSAFAFIVKDVNDNILYKGGEFIGNATNNIVEARGIISALSWALQHGKDLVHLFSDSELIVKQINGEYKIRNPQLAGLHKQIYELMRKFSFCEVVQIERSLNKEADKLADKILKQALSGSEQPENNLEEQK
ncbi:MAG: ribonuclease HI family protein [Candidatus Sumerlaeia bacterium]|nr:ribonuclease HI family protein [Candidatus Sumerlaeia bacterium]